MRRFDAVIFDLFGTLIKNFDVPEHDRLIVEMVALLDIAHGDFAPLWNDATWPQRATGEFDSPEANIRYICRTLQREVAEEQIASAADLRRAFTRKSLAAWPDAVPTLKALRQDGYAIGLVSDCSSEVPLFWAQTPLAPLVDAAIFSCAVGLKKPDPRIYRLASDQLGVAPERCLYIGDGGSQELTGAQAAGMIPVLIRHTLEGDRAYRREAENWSGAAITSLAQVMSLVQEE
jgi:putative hydrolase of the HAD superfamily